MKRIILCIISAVILLLPLSAQAEYGTYYDVFNDIKLLLGDDPDTAWSIDPGSAKSTAASLEGFSCSDAGDAVICEKSHWTGEYKLTLYFSENSLAAIECLLTGPTIQDLNYGPDTAYVQPAEDLIKRMTSFGLIPADAQQQTDADLFPDPEISPYHGVYPIAGDTLLQAGFRSKTDTDPKFRLAFIFASGNFAEQAGAGAISMPEPAADVPDPAYPFRHTTRYSDA